MNLLGIFDSRYKKELKEVMTYKYQVFATGVYYLDLQVKFSNQVYGDKYC